MTDAASDILALIPAYNEALRLGPVVAGALTYLPVLVVDDGSADETAQVAEAAGATVLRQQHNQGKGAALKAGFQRAVDIGCQAVVTLDADGQHDPAELPAFLAAYKARQPDLIIGQRDFRQMPPIRRLANWLGGKAFAWALGQPVPDNQSGYRLISRRLMLDMIGSQEQGFEYEVEMIAVAVGKGYPIESVPIQTIYTGEGSHISPVHHLVNFLRITWQTRQRARAAAR